MNEPGYDDMDEPVPLSLTVKRFFPSGGITVNSFRTEARKGRLTMMQIAGKDFVTRRAILEMMERCLADVETNTERRLMTVKDVATRLPGVSERALRQRIRSLGCYTKIGKGMWLTEEDFQQLVQKGRPKRSNSATLVCLGPQAAGCQPTTMRLWLK